MDVYLTFFEILTLKARKWTVFPTPPLFDVRCGGTSLEFVDKTYPAKTRVMEVPYGENFIVLISTVFD